jgi:hypothetical protein
MKDTIITKDHFEAAYYRVFGYEVYEVRFLRDDKAMQILPEFVIKGKDRQRRKNRYERLKEILDPAYYEKEINNPAAS